MASFKFKQENCYAVAAIVICGVLFAVGFGIGILVALNV